jgi:integrase
MKPGAVHIDRFASPTHVFCGPRGAHLRSSEWRTIAWRRAVEAATLAPLRRHDLKHTGVAFLAAAGVGVSEIARRAGHSSVAFTYDHYGHLLPEVDKAAATELDQLRLQARL